MLKLEILRWGSCFEYLELNQFMFLGSYVSWRTSILKSCFFRISLWCQALRQICSCLCHKAWSPILICQTMWIKAKGFHMMVSVWIIQSVIWISIYVPTIFIFLYWNFKCLTSSISKLTSLPSKTMLSKHQVVDLFIIFILYPARLSLS